jgi:uncharacterized membrane protein
MRGETVIDLVLLGECLLVSLLFPVLPKISPRGSLFSVFLGEEGANGSRARELTASWMRAGSVVLVGSLAVAAAALWTIDPPASALVATLLPVLAFFGLYRVFHRRAREIRRPVPVPPPVAVSPPSVHGAPHLVLFVFAICVGIALVLLARTAEAWPRLPERVPIHFGASGLPDGWAEKSVASVFLVPILALVMAVVLGATTALVSLVRDATRTAMTFYMGGIAVIVQGMLLVLGSRSLDVALGLREGLGPATWVFLALLLGWTLGGVVWIAVRNRKIQSADPGADDRFWKAGLVYVNREDPSLVVPKRFGIGFTFNFGNRWAWLLLLLILAAPLMVLVVALAAA